ncbi:MAG: PAS domain-containing protein, partial [Lachnospiraceae bacterium]|nr:PAS domain-containing protein [Lachnospiraceae bacterium]
MMDWNENGAFPIEDALEMIFVFDQAGIISYANATARKKLEYEDELCGKSISDIFPGTFKSVEGAFETDCQFGSELQALVAYRKNLTCFPVEAKIIESSR